MSIKFDKKAPANRTTILPFDPIFLKLLKEVTSSLAELGVNFLKTRNIAFKADQRHTEITTAINHILVLVDKHGILIAELMKTNTELSNYYKNLSETYGVVYSENTN